MHGLPYHQQPAGRSALDGVHHAVDDAVLRLEQIGVHEVVVDRADVPYEMRLPCEPDGVRAEDVDHRRRVNHGVGRLEGRVRLPEDEDGLVLEVGGVDGDVLVTRRQFDAGDVRDVGPAHAGGHDQPAGGEPHALGVLDVEMPGLGALLDAPHAVAVADAQMEPLGEVVEVLHVGVRGREVLLRVMLHQHRLGRVRQQRVPVVPQVEVELLPPRVDLVDGDQFAVAGILGEELTCLAARLDDDIAPACPLEEIPELESGRACANDDIIVDLLLIGCHGVPPRALFRLSLRSAP